jgi:nucleoside-diphosphate-sugar epimerase
MKAVEPRLAGGGATRLSEGADRIVVTGAGSWIGLATLEMLEGLLGADFPRRVVGFGSRARTLRLRSGAEIKQQPLSALAELPAAPSHVLHLAFVTQGPGMTLGRDAYVEANQAIAGTVLAALDRIGARSVFQASSGAVHLRDPDAGPQSKGLYGALKYADEAAFATWARRRGATAAIGRVFNISGPYINRRYSYALSSMIEDALAGRPVRVRSAAPVIRSYVAIETLMGVAAGLLTEPEGGVSLFETAGERAVEVGELAQAIAEELGAPGVERPNFDPTAPADRYVGDGAAFNAMAKTYGAPRRQLASQIRQTATYMAAFPERA